MAEELKMMNKWQKLTRLALGVVPLVLAATSALAQVPVDDSGNLVGDWENRTSGEVTGNEGIPLLGPQELQGLVGPVALYPDELLAIVLPASTYPLQVVQAARFLEKLKTDPALEPDPDWDDSIVALLNYPEVVELLNEDLDWTWQLGEAVVAQQSDVISAAEAFRNSAYAAGNLRSDDYQEVSKELGTIEISPVNEDVIYVPYYEPSQVVVRQPAPAYYYYDQPYPVYYYPYPDSYSFNRGYFWGVTTAFSIGWASDSLHVYHQGYRGHPYYGRDYRSRWWYRRPSIGVHNGSYFGGNDYASHGYAGGDHWRSNRNVRLRHSDQRITRSRDYPRQRAQHLVSNDRRVSSSNHNRVANNRRATSNHNRVANNRRATSNHNRVANNRRATSSNHNRVSNNRRVTSSNHNRVSNNRRATSSNHNRVSNNRRATSNQNLVANNRRATSNQNLVANNRRVASNHNRVSNNRRANVQRRDYAERPRNTTQRRSEPRRQARKESRRQSRNETRNRPRSQTNKQVRQKRPAQQRQSRNRDKRRRSAH